MFLVVGIQTPFWPAWLAGRGLDPRQIAWVLAAALWAKVVATPLIGAAADRFGRRPLLMVTLAATALFAYAGLWPAAGFGAVLWLNLLAGTAQSVLLPLGDSLTLAAVRAEGFDYGRIRLWGSVSFILGASGSGLLLSAGLPFVAPGERVLVLVLFASGILIAACLGLPRTLAQSRSSRGTLARMAGDPRFWLFVATGAMLQASHQVYYAFGTLYWRAQGWPDSVIGLLWAEGVVAEIVLFWFGERALARLGPLGLMGLGGAAGMVRWSLVGIVPGLPAAAGLQLLHALTFGASHLGAMHFLSRSVPPAANSSAQGLYSAASTGLGSGLVMLAAGALYQAYGGSAYLFMAALSGIGLAGVGLLGASRRHGRILGRN